MKNIATDKNVIDKDGMFISEVRSFHHCSCVSYLVCLYALAFRGTDFRPQYRTIGLLRSFLPKDVQNLALTATATEKIKQDVCKSLLMSEPCLISLSSTRRNIYYDVKRCKVGDFSGLKWLIELLRSEQKEAPKTIVFCHNVKTVASIFEYVSSEQEEDQFVDCKIEFKKHLVAMFHRSTAKVNKDFVFQSSRNLILLYALLFVHHQLRWD